MSKREFPLTPLPRKANGLYESPPLELVYDLHVENGVAISVLADGWSVSEGSVRRWVRLALARHHRENVQASPVDAAEIDEEPPAQRHSGFGLPAIPRPPRHEIHEQYVELQKSLSQTADHFDVSTGTLRKWMAAFGIETRSRAEAAALADPWNKLPVPPRKELELLYDEFQFTQEEMADWYGVNIGTIVRQLEERGIPFRSSTDASNQRFAREKLLREYLLEIRKGHREVPVDVETTAPQSPDANPGCYSLLAAFIANEFDLQAVSELSGVAPAEAWKRMLLAEPRLDPGFSYTDPERAELPPGLRLEPLAPGTSNGEDVITAYVENKESIRSLAERFNTAFGVVKDYLEFHGVRIRSKEEQRRVEAVTARPSRERLRQLYIEEKMSLNEMSETLGSDRHAISRWLDDEGIPRRAITSPHSLERPGRALLYDFFITRALSLRDIGEELGTSMTTVKRWLQEADLYTDEMRTKHKRQKKQLKKQRRAAERPSKAELEAAYFDDRRTLEELGDYYGVSTWKVRQWFKAAGIESRPKGKAP